MPDSRESSEIAGSAEGMADGDESSPSHATGAIAGRGLVLLAPDAGVGNPIDHETRHTR